MPKQSKEGVTRKEVDLENGVIKTLEAGAKRDSRKLKNYMEKILVDKSVEIKNKEAEKVGGKK